MEKGFPRLLKLADYIPIQELQISWPHVMALAMAKQNKCLLLAGERASHSKMDTVRDILSQHRLAEASVRLRSRAWAGAPAHGRGAARAGPCAGKRAGARGQARLFLSASGGDVQPSAVGAEGFAASAALRERMDANRFASQCKRQFLCQYIRNPGSPSSFEPPDCWWSALRFFICLIEIET